MKYCGKNKKQLDKLSGTLGIRNNNPFNIRYSQHNAWLGKLSPDENGFERFKSLDYGLRAGVLLLLNGYIRKGFNTVPKIIAKYAPSSENNVSRYVDYVLTTTSLHAETVISIHSLSFYHLCRAITYYESKYVLTYEMYISIVKHFNLFPL